MAKKRARKAARKAATATVNTETAEHYAIAEILDSRRNENSQLEYLIKWPDSSQSWQLVDDLFSKKKSSKALSVSSLKNDEMPTSSRKRQKRDLVSALSLDSLQEVSEGSSHENALKKKPIEYDKTMQVATSPKSTQQKPQPEDSSDDEPILSPKRPKRNQTATRSETPVPVKRNAKSKRNGKVQSAKVASSLGEISKDKSTLEKPRPEDSSDDEPILSPKRTKINQKTAYKVATVQAKQDAKPTGNPFRLNVQSAAAQSKMGRDVDRVEIMRKDNNGHQYLVKWKDDDEDHEWLSRDTMVTKYPQQLIAYFERNIKFTDPK